MIKINTTNEDSEICTPDAQLLNTPIGIQDVTCPLENCGRVVKSSSALRLHIQKTHGISNEAEKSDKKKLFACPALSCTWNFSSLRKNYFKSMYLLKRHYLSVHGERKFGCEKCGKKFGTEMSSIQHFQNCRKLFYCLCGLNYSTKQLLKTHLLRNNRADHKAVADPEEDKQKEMNKGKLLNGMEKPSSEMQTVTVPCFLYIPKENAERFKNQQQITVQSSQIQTENSHSPEVVVNNLNADKFVRILPKKKNVVQEPFQFIDPTQIGSYYNSLHSGLLQHIATNFKNSEVNAALLQTINSQSQSVETDSLHVQGKKNKIKKKREKSAKVKKLVNPKESKFEKNMKFVNSNVAQEALADEALMKSTLYDLHNKKNNCKNAKLGKGKICRHFLPMEPAKVGNQNLITNFTQTIDISTQASEFVHTGIQTNNDPFSILEVLETSDFSSQCKLPGILSDTQGLPFHETIPIDTQTQTDDMNFWLSSFQQPSNTNLADMQTQTQNQQLLDKSVQLDDILSGKTWDTECSIYVRDLNTDNDHCIPSLFLSNGDYKQTISTQTLNSEEGTESSIADRDIVLPSQNVVAENAGTSFGTQTIFDEERQEEMECSNRQETLSFGTQTGFEDNFFSSSGTQTWEADETSINAKTIETQTAISFADLLDSSFIDEYLGSDRISSAETQTHIFEPKELNTTQTQTL